MSLLAAIKARCSKRAEEEGGRPIRTVAAAGGRITCALKQPAGFTLTEALATVIIVGLVTSILAGGIALASRQYTQSMANSEAQMLSSSLQKILDTELRFTQTIITPDNPKTKLECRVSGFASKHYKAQKKNGNTTEMEETSCLCTVVFGADGSASIQEPETPGQLAMASGFEVGDVYNPLLGSGAYNYGLQASIEDFTYNVPGKYFTLTLIISQGGGDDAPELAKETFTVKALNIKDVKQG